jgi:hypothetical protein
MNDKNKVLAFMGLNATMGGMGSVMGLFGLGHTDTTPPVEHAMVEFTLAQVEQALFKFLVVNKNIPNVRSNVSLEYQFKDEDGQKVADGIILTAVPLLPKDMKAEDWKPTEGKALKFKLEQVEKVLYQEMVSSKEISPVAYNIHVDFKTTMDAEGKVLADGINVTANLVKAAKKLKM